jgi:hypothetical protein
MAIVNWARIVGNMETAQGVTRAEMEAIPEDEVAIPAGAKSWLESCKSCRV